MEFVFGQFRLNTSSRSLYHSSKEIELSERAYLLLFHLAEASPELVSKETLLEKLWPDRVVSDWALSRLLSDTRAILSEYQSDQDLIKTARGLGYALHDVEHIASPDPQSARVSATAADSNRSSINPIYLLVPVFVLLIGVGGGKWLQEGMGNSTTQDPNSVVQSIAVLPLEAFSDEEELEYFADGLSEELIHQLAMLPELKVVSRNATFAFKNQNIDPRELAEKLNVTHILEGSVRQPGDRVRITLQLIRANDGYHQWSKAFDGDRSSMLKVQEDIGGSIAQLISPEYQHQSVTLMRKHPESDEAYTHFLKAAALMGKDDINQLRAAQVELDNALAIEPGYGLAHAAKAKTLLLLHQFAQEPLTINGPEALKHITLAMESEPQLAEAYSALGLYHTYHNSFNEAEKAYLSALSINPSLVSAQHNLGFAYWLQNRYVQAREHFEYALALNPLAPMSNFGLADAMFSGGDLDNAVAQYEHCLFVIPEFPACQLGYANLVLMMGDVDKARQLEQATVVTLGPNNPYVVALGVRIAMWQQQWQEANDRLKPLISVNASYEILRDMTQLQLALDKGKAWLETMEALLVQRPESNVLRLTTALAAYYEGNCSRSLALYEQVFAENPYRHSGLAEFSMGISHAANMAHCYLRMGSSVEQVKVTELLQSHMLNVKEASVDLPGLAYVRYTLSGISGDKAFSSQQGESQWRDWPLAWLDDKVPLNSEKSAKRL